MRMRMHAGMVRLLLLVGVPGLVIAGGLFIWQLGGRYITTENAYVKADIVQISPEVAGRIVEVSVRDHTQVSLGDLLLRIDPEPYRLALARAEAELDSARSAVETARATYHETQSELAELESRAEYLARQAARQSELNARGAAPVTKMEEAQNDAQVARERINVVRQRLARVLTGLLGNPTLPADEHPRVREQLAARDRAKLDLSHTNIFAPAAGVVVNVKLQPGEQVRAGVPIFSLVAGRRPWVEANLKETTLGTVRVGQRVEVTLDIYPDFTWTGEIASISPATGAEFAILPPQNASGNWVKVVQRLPVRIHLLPKEGEPALRAGMTASISIDTERQRQMGALISSITSYFRGTAKAADQR